MDTNVSSTASSPSFVLRLISSTRDFINPETASEITIAFRQMLPAERLAINQAFAAHDAQQVWFLCEKLLGAAVYFDVPDLQVALNKVVVAGDKKMLATKLLSKINTAIDAILMGVA